MLLSIGKSIPHENFAMVTELVKGVEEEYLRSQSMATLMYLMKDDAEAGRLAALGVLSSVRSQVGAAGQPGQAGDENLDDQAVIAARKASEERFVTTRETLYSKAFCSTPAIVRAMQQVRNHHLSLLSTVPMAGVRYTRACRCVATC